MLRFLLTCVEIAVFGKVVSHSVELVGGVVATVAVKLDAGGEFHHQGGQGGDLIEYVLVLLQQGGHVGFKKKKKKKERNLEIC